MSNRLGLNVNPLGMSPDNCINLLKRSGASTHVVLENVGFAQEAVEKTGHTIISRADYPDDTATEPKDLVAHWSERHKTAPDVYHYWPNEPQADIKTLLATMDHLMDEVVDAGLKACLGNFAWADILQPDDVDAGLWDDFLRKASAFTNEGHGFIGGHEYTTGALPWGTAGFDVNQMLNPPLPYEGWPTFHDIWHADKTDYLLFRWVPLAHRCAMLNIEFPRLVVTECFWDRMTNLENIGFIQKLDSKYRGGSKCRGIISQRDYFHFFWPKWGALDGAVKQLEWAEQTYSPHVHGFCMFALTQDSKWQDYNFGDWPELLEALPAIPGAKHL